MEDFAQPPPVSGRYRGAGVYALATVGLSPAAMGNRGGLRTAPPASGWYRGAGVRAGDESAQPSLPWEACSRSQNANGQSIIEEVAQLPTVSGRLLGGRLLC